MFKFLFPKTIRAKLIVIILSLIIIISTPLSFASYLYYTSFLKDEIFDRLKVVVNSKVDSIEFFLKDQNIKVDIISNDHHFSDILIGSRLEFTQDFSLEEHYQDVINGFRYNEFLELFVLNNDGIIILSTNPVNVGSDKSSENFFLNSGVHIDDIFLYKNNVGAIPVSTFIEKGGKKIGSLVAIIDKSGLDKLLTERVGLGDTGETYLVNNDFLLVSPSRFLSNTFLNTKVETENSKKCFKDYEIYVQKGLSNIKHELELNLSEGYRGVKVLGTHSHFLDGNLCLLVEIDESEVLSLVHELLFYTIVISLIALIFVFIIISWVVIVLTRPIKTLKKGIDLVRQGDLDYRVGTNSSDEIGELSRAFDNMTISIKESRSKIDDKVEEQTKELTKQRNIAEKSKVRTEEMNTLMVGRELKMIELKKEILRLSDKINKFSNKKS
ncbi:HAMP domain-containing protein [Patescibacteria group bacterium]